MSMNACHCFGIVTNDRDKAIEKLWDIINSNTEKPCKVSINTFEVCARYPNFDLWVWVKPSDHARGYRFHKLWLDADLEDDKDTLDNFVYPKLYMEFDDVRWF